MIPNACVVEVIERVPDADVAIVAARVGERLGMPQERVRQLIDGRTGPITRALRPEKADAIAQTFEAAGVRVVIRAADPDEIDEARAGAVRPTDPEPATEREAEPDSVAEPEGDPELEPEPEPEFDAEPEPDLDAEFDTEPEPEIETERVAASAHELGREPAPDPEPDAVVALEPEREPEPETDPEHGLEREGYVPVDHATDVDIETDADLDADAAAWVGPGFDDEPDVDAPMVADEPDVSPPSFEPHHGFDDHRDGDEAELEHGRALASEAEFDRDPPYVADVQPDPHADFDVQRAVDLDADAELDTDVDPDLDPDLDPGVDPDLDPDPDLTWQDEDLVPGPDAPSEQALAREVAYIFATGESPAWRGSTDDLDTPIPDEERAHPTNGADYLVAGGPGGVLDVDEHDDADDGARSADEDAPEHGARDEAAVAADGFAPTSGWDADGAGAWRSRREGDAHAGDAHAGDGRAPEGRPQVPEYAIGRASRRPRDADPEPPPELDLEVAAEDAFTEPPHVAPERPVPTAWRGLGDAEAGPARPPSARLPRRSEPTEYTKYEFDDPPVRRRAVMLAALGVSIVLFVIAQWWVASRAGAAGIDPFDAYRRGEFQTARAAWDVEAAAGDPSARFMLGYLAEAGLGAPWSARTAAGWYQAAADGGHAEAMWRLARLYEVGLGVGPDAAEARRWYRSAALAGHAEAAFAWGRMVLLDAGVALGAGAAPHVAPATAVEAAAAFERAAELGWHEAAPYAAAFAALGVERP